jgi:hypothetical protein
MTRRKEWEGRGDDGDDEEEEYSLGSEWISSLVDSRI